MTSIEELLAAFGGTISIEADGIRLQIEEWGDEAVEPMFRAVTDADYREQIWRDYGHKYEGELWFRQGNPENKGPRFDKTMWMNTLKGNALSWFSEHPKRRESPIAELLPRAQESFHNDSSRPSREFLGIPNNAWTRYLDACGQWDLAGVRAYFAGGAVQENAAEAGMGMILGDLTLSEERGIAPQAREIMEFLVERCADVDTELHPNIGCVALQYAAQRSNRAMVEWLLDHGAKINTADYDGRTALMFALEGDGRTDEQTLAEQRAMILYLIERGADVNFQAHKEYSATGDIEALEFTGPTAGDFATPKLRQWLEAQGITLPPATET